jgi:hypothetical protein
MIPWPTDVLPNPTLDWSNTVDPAVVRTRMENGAFRQRRQERRQRALHYLTGFVVLTTQQDARLARLLQLLHHHH